MFDFDDLNIDIINIFLINRKKCEYDTPKRPFHILTKRIKGYSDMFFKDADFRLEPNHLFYIPANTEYSRKSYDDEEIVAIHFNITNRIISAPAVISVERDKTDNALLQMYNIWCSHRTGYKYKCTSMLYELLSEIIVPKKRSKAFSTLEKSIEYINENISSKISVKHLADISNVGENYYRILFRQEFGVSPVEYINNKRIFMAEEMLLSDCYSISEISYACGFSEPRYFNTVFKKIAGMSPTQFKCSF